MAIHLIQKPAGHTGAAFGCLPGIKIVNGSFEFQTPICVASPRNPTHQSCFVGLPGGWVISDYSPFMGTHFSEWAHKSLSKGSLGIGTSPKSQEYTRLLAKFEMRSCHLQRLQMEKTNLVKFLALFGRESNVCIFIVYSMCPMEQSLYTKYTVSLDAQCSALIKKRVVEKGYIRDTTNSIFLSSISDT